MKQPAEETTLHTRLLKCTLEIDDCRAYWRQSEVARAQVTPQKAFEEYWFGARSLGRTKVLLVNMKARFDKFPEAMAVLNQWPDMDPETRRAICHWHVQLSDPMYRAFTGQFLVDRRDSANAKVTRDLVVNWVESQGPGRWGMNMKIEVASKLLSAAFSAGLVASNRDPRPLCFPRVPDLALGYLLYLLRETEFAGALLDNPYLRSVGLVGATLEERLRSLPELEFRRQGDLIEYGWQHSGLQEWASCQVGGSADSTGGHE